MRATTRELWLLVCIAILMATVVFLSVSLFLCGFDQHSRTALSPPVYIVSDARVTVPHEPTYRASRSRPILARMAAPHESHRAVSVRPASRPQATMTGRSAFPGSSFSAQELRIRSCESGDGRTTYDYQAHNGHSSASGAWQFLRSTWNYYQGYSEAAAAPQTVQDAFARKVLDEQGMTPWASSRACWG